MSHTYICIPVLNAVWLIIKDVRANMGGRLLPVCNVNLHTLPLFASSFPCSHHYTLLSIMHKIWYLFDERSVIAPLCGLAAMSLGYGTCAHIYLQFDCLCACNTFAALTTRATRPHTWPDEKEVTRGTRYTCGHKICPRTTRVMLKNVENLATVFEFASFWSNRWNIVVRTGFAAGIVYSRLSVFKGVPGTKLIKIQKKRGKPVDVR